MKFSARLWFFFSFLFCAGLIGAALYFQHAQGLEPCPLCISQRIAVVVAGAVFLAATLQDPGTMGIRIYGITGFLAAATGAAIAGRHVWLQHLPPEEVPECGPGLEYMFQNFPITQTLKFMLSGTGDCAKVDWTLLGFSMPAWTFVCFVTLALVSLAQCWNVKRLSNRNVIYRI
ncbi:disulfide bond formation protein B [Methylogaea oryzae]|uniref:Disulfide bond formation protein B n=1 Tax=Methylogaea oryzae TaxID=1295382 RepID=A0A8D4VT29_9GAMM|nr:disulfide bond formation protein B [Methylogaea oryzae]BBL72774.1 disulfide bond formation protein B 1 [Methylogaea oryzae]